MLGKVKCAGILAAVMTAGLAVAACNDNNNDADDIIVNPQFAAIDVNGDEVITTTEWNAEFAVLDVNHDGVIEASEWQFTAASFATVDVNGDGVVSVAEWDAAIRTFDINGNGVIEATELDAVLI